MFTVLCGWFADATATATILPVTLDHGNLILIYEPEWKPTFYG